MATKQHLVKYLNPGYSSGLIAIFPLIIGLAAIFADRLLAFRIIIAVIMLGTGVYFIWTCINAQLKFSEQIRQMENDGALEKVISDFARGSVLLDDHLRLGETYVFGKKSGIVLDYSQLTKIYQYVHKTNGVENYRSLQVVTADKKVHQLCKIKLRGKADSDVQLAVGVILSKNPSVHVGYN